MTLNFIKKYCLSKYKAYEDYPFGPVPICYKLNNRVFAQVYPKPDDYKITLKCTAEAGMFYRQLYPGTVVRGYHCPPVQQPYWNTVYLDGFSYGELINMIDEAYDAVLRGFSKKVQEKILSREDNIVNDTDKLVKLLSDKNNTTACGAMKSLVNLAEKSDEVYAYMDTFAQMLKNTNSYVRNRALKLIAANARWDVDFKIDEIIDEYLRHVTDIKPITARQCISSLAEIARYKPELKEDILTALSCADVSHYPDSMSSLVCSDIRKATKEIECL